MKTVYANTGLDKELFCKDVLSPLVAQFPNLLRVTITSYVDPLGDTVGTKSLDVINIWGETEFTYFDCDELSCVNLSLIIAQFLIDYNKTEYADN